MNVHNCTDWKKKSQENSLICWKKFIFLQDNALAHKSIKAIIEINDLRFEFLPHPLYSPDLPPSDFYLFPNLKRWVQRQRFSSKEEVKWETDDYFGGLRKSYYKRGIVMLKDRPSEHF